MLSGDANAELVQGVLNGSRILWNDCVVEQCADSNLRWIVYAYPGDA